MWGTDAMILGQTHHLIQPDDSTESSRIGIPDDCQCVW